MASRNTKLTRWIVGVIAVVLVVVVGGPFVYFHFIQADPPPKLTVGSVTVPTTAPGTTAAPLAGTWKVGNNSVVRYRIKETIFGQSGTAVGSTNSVTGSMTIAGTKVTAGHFVVDMTTFKSDKSQRDNQFQGRIMNTSEFPTATFTLTKPIELAPVPADGETKSYSATGKLEIHGTTNDVTLTLNTSRQANTIAVQGSTTITFSDYGINDPSGGPASVGNSGELEFLLEFAPAPSAS